MTEKKITWTRSGKDLIARLPVAPRGTVWFLREEDIVPIQQWCEETGCGRRMSFDTFRFKRRVDMTLFLMRWS